MSARETWFSALRRCVKFALLRVIAAPLNDTPPRNLRLWRLWLKVMEARYEMAEAAWGRDRARIYDYIPF